MGAMRRLLILSILAAVACGAPDDDAETRADSPAEAEGLIQGTPEGGALDWVADIDAGLDSVPVLLGRAPATVQSHVLDLYVSRQEYLEMYYGPNGRLESSPSLAEAIDGNEARFHDLMQAVSAETPDSAEVAALADSLAAQTARVREAAESVDRELSPWSDGGS